MPAKKKAPAKKVAKKTAVKRAEGPSRRVRAKKGTPGTPKASKPVKRAVRVVEPPPPPPPPPPDPNFLGEGSVSLVGPGRLHWEAKKDPEGVTVRFVPSGVSAVPRRISLTMSWRAFPTATSAGKILENGVVYQFQPFPGWENGFSVTVTGVEGAPEVS